MSVDPTKIDIEFDPLRQRMVGISAHGLKPFDVPFISEIVPDLWVGGCEDGLILPEFIEQPDFAVSVGAVHGQSRVGKLTRGADVRQHRSGF